MDMWIDSILFTWSIWQLRNLLNCQCMVNVKFPLMKLYTGQQNLKIEPDSSPPDIFFNYFTVGEKKSTDEENLVDGGDIKTI